MKNYLKMAFFSLFLSANCFATELILVDSSTAARYYDLNEDSPDKFYPLYYSSKGPAKAIFINPEQITVQTYVVNSEGFPVLNVEMYNKYP